MQIKVVAYELGCEPSPSVTSEILISGTDNAFLLFEIFGNGIAVVEIGPNAGVKIGYPNDEGLIEHPCYKYGMDNIETDVMEVVNSPWSEEVMSQMEASSERIWGGRGMAIKPREPKYYRHFVIALKEKTFECISSSLELVGTFDSFKEANDYVFRNLGDAPGF